MLHLFSIYPTLHCILTLASVLMPTFKVPFRTTLDCVSRTCPLHLSLVSLISAPLTHKDTVARSSRVSLYTLTSIPLLLIASNLSHTARECVASAVL